jgi:hypothetical protein
MDERDLPEGVIDADPAGGWESAGAADAETDAQSRDAAGSPRLTDAGSPANSETPDAEIVETDVVETDELSQGADPDLSADEDA